MKRIISLLLILCLLCGCKAEATTDLTALVAETAAVLLERTPEPSFGSVGGEWAVFGLCRWGGELPDGWLEGYEERLSEYVAGCSGILHERKYTEYSRVVLAVTAMGGDAADVAGYDLTAPLEDFDQTVFQGVNGAIYALLALDCGNYGSEDVRTKYVSHILDSELSSGGWALMGDAPEADLTAMALQALAKYRSDSAVSEAVDRGVKVLAGCSFDTSEAVSQALVACVELGLDAEDYLGRLLAFRTEDGLFRHTMESDGDALATEQAFYALVALKNGALYRMTANTCTIEVRCDTLLSHMDELTDGKAALVPEDGVLLARTTVEFEAGETVFDVFRRCLRDQNIHFEYVDARAYDSVYIEGIGNLYEFDCGERSGWMFSVNGVFPSLGCSAYPLSNGDAIVFHYTCDLGADLEGHG